MRDRGFERSFPLRKPGVFLLQLADPVLQDFDLINGTLYALPLDKLNYTISRKVVNHQLEAS